MTIGASTLSLRDALQLYLDSLRRAGRTPSTLDSYQRYLDYFVGFVEAQVGGRSRARLRHLTPDLVGQAQDALAAKATGSRGGAAAVAAMVLRVKMFSIWLWRRDYLATDPLARVQKVSLPILHRRPFSETEAKRLLINVAGGPNPVMERALLLLGFDTGGRIGEICAVDVGDLDMDKASVLFRHTKNGRPRLVFFGVETALGGGPCAVALRQWLRERPETLTKDGQGEQALFLNRHGERLTVAQARNIYKALGRATGVAAVFPHRTRHTHASELLAELPGAEMHLRRRLGHLSNEVLSFYVQINDREAQKIAATASLSNKWGL
jgi:integrase/recombinase XerC